MRAETHALWPLVTGAFFRARRGAAAVPDLDLHALLTAKQAAGYAGVSIPVICKWRERGHLPVAVDTEGNEIRDERGRPRYRLLDVAKAENATRQRAERMASRIVRRDTSQGLAA